MASNKSLNSTSNTSLFNKNTLLAWGLGLAYAVGVLNNMHYIPDTAFAGGSLATGVLALTLVVILWIYPLQSINLSSLTWLGLALLIALQPLINTIDYADSLLFPVVGLLLATILSIAVYNLNNKTLFVKHLAVIVLVVGVLTLITQLVQLTVSAENTPSWITALPKDKPPYGNINQQNVAAYMLSLSLISLFFIYYHWRLSLAFLLFGVFLLAIGDGMTTSRAGIILFAVTMVVMIFFYQQENKKIKLFCLTTITAIAGFYLGAWLVDFFLGQSESGVERLAGGSIYMRLSLLNQAWLIIQEQPITGAGWGNYAGEGLKHAEQLRWFSLSTHAHSIFPQIMAELGLLGLIMTMPVIVVVLRTIRLSYSAEKLFPLAVVVITGLYSFSEFPLWYFYFLALAAACTACLDIKTVWKPRKMTSLLAIAFSLLTAIGSVYYLNKYIDIAATTTLLASKKISNEDKYRIYRQQENVFAFSPEKEALLFLVLSINDEDLQEKIVFSERVVGHAPQAYNIIRLAQLYALNNDKRALTMIKAACLYNNGGFCHKVTENIEQLAKDYPDAFSGINKDYHDWLKTQEHKLPHKEKSNKNL